MLITYINYRQKLFKKCIEVSSRIVNMSFRPKLWIEHVRCDQTRNGFRGTNSCFKCTPKLIFALGQVRQQNGTKPKVVYWACLLQKNETVLEAQTRALNVP